MNSTSPTGVAAQSVSGWRIEKPRAPAAYGAPFFAEMNNGVYEGLLHRLPASLHVMDGSGRMQAANATWLKILGYELRDVVGRSFSEFMPAESRTKLITAIYPRYLVSGECQAEELLLLHKDGSLVTVSLSMTPFRGDNGRLQKSVCLIEDITAKKIAEITLNRGDQRFRSAFTSSVLGVAIVSPNGGVEFANKAMRDFLKRDDIEQIAISFDELLHRDDRGQFLNGMRQILSGDVPSLQQELRFMTGEGKVAHGTTTVSQVKSEHGETEQLIIQVLDISERKTLNNRLQSAQKMEAVGQLSSGLAQDFNNLLAIISGNLQLLEGKFDDDEKANKRLGEALLAAQKGSDLTRQLLAFAGKQNLEPKDISPNSLLKSMEPLLARTVGDAIDFRVTVMAGDPRVLIDPAQLESAVLSLAINARDAMPNGGKLTIETQPAYLDHHYAALNPDVSPGHYLLVSVSDSGTGMSPELVGKVFQPFFTTKPMGQGEGLGLSVVYGFIKQSGGHISIDSEIGHGTTVKMYIPRRMRQGEEAGQIYPELDVSLANGDVTELQRKPRILVVEDQEAVRAVACGFLEDFGYDVIEAGDGFEALSKLQEYDDIDLMFSDVVMPGGMNGFDLAQAAQSMKPELKVVHTSGYPKGAMVHQDEPRFKEGFIIMKPYRREDLQKIIKDALESQ